MAGGECHLTPAELLLCFGLISWLGFLIAGPAGMWVAGTAATAVWVHAIARGARWAGGSAAPRAGVTGHAA